MRTLSEEERFEIKKTKANWKKNNRGRKLFIGNSLSDIKILIELSDYANGLLTKNKSK